MKVKQLFIKPKRGEPLQTHQTLILHKGYGIESDIHAQVGSPRQVLLASLQTLKDFGLKPADLAENILIDQEIEQFSSGQVLRVGKNVLIRLMFLCEPCYKLDKIQPSLANKIKNKRGFLGLVVRGGKIHQDDEISLTSYQFPRLSNEAKGRFWEFVPRIPINKVVKTSDLLLALGLSQAYYRAIPTFLKSAQKLPIHRLVSADGSLFCKYIPTQAELLQEEGVEIQFNRVLNHNCYWKPNQFHELELRETTLT